MIRARTRRPAWQPALHGLPGRLAGDDTVGEDGPLVAETLADLGGRGPFVPAVVPFEEILVDLGMEPGELGRPAGAGGAS